MARTADGVEVCPGMTLYIAEAILECNVMSLGPIEKIGMTYDDRTISVLVDGWWPIIGAGSYFSTRLAALLAAHSRAADEVERLAGEIEKERGNG